jgi:murein DD-endopeptidase MepM/ murein hydrolase activator NlpD
MVSLRKIRILLLLLPLFLCSCAGGNFVSFFSSYDRNGPIHRLENQINVSTGMRYGHVILVYNLLDLNIKNDNHSLKGGIQASSFYLYLTSVDVDQEKFNHLINVLIQKVVVKTQNLSKVKHTLNINATQKIKEFITFLTALDHRLKSHKFQSHNQVRVVVEKMVSYLKREGKNLDKLSLEQKLRILQKINSVLEKVPLTNPLTSYVVTDRFRMRPGSFFKNKKMHSGIDLCAPKSSDVFASAAGTVIYAGWKEGYGSIVIIDHGRGINTYYAHLRSIGVRAGRKVLVGERIGIQGNTGHSSGDHLHYEIRFNNKPINPEILKRF